MCITLTEGAVQEWQACRHMHENYNAEDGWGVDPNPKSDPFYHWGGLLGLIGLLDDGAYAAPKENH